MKVFRTISGKVNIKMIETKLLILRLSFAWEKISTASSEIGNEFCARKIAADGLIDCCKRNDVILDTCTYKIKIFWLYLRNNFKD